MLYKFCSRKAGNKKGHKRACCKPCFVCILWIYKVDVFYFFFFVFLLFCQKSLGERMPGTRTEQTGVGPRDLLSPETGSLVRQLEVRIKELKGWLRDTELFIFNSCLRKEKEETLYTQKQLQYFKVTGFKIQHLHIY